MATPGPSTTFQRRLVRDGLQTPWGFRLQGGKDFNQPLTVQRVFTGSPAEGELQRGDIVTAINNRDTETLVHKDALEIIKRSGSELLLSVQRGPNRYQAPNQPTTPQVPYHYDMEGMSRYHNYQLHEAPTHEAPHGHYNRPHHAHSHSADHTPSYAPYLAAPQPHPPPQQHLYTLPHQPSSPPKQGYRPVQFSATGPVPVSPTKTASYGGVVYGPPGGQSGPMINRVQESLHHAAYQRPEDEEDYDYKTVSQRKAVFQQSSGGPRRPPQSRGRKWQPPQSGGGMTFGWSPSVRLDPNYRPGPPAADATNEFKPTRQVGPGHQKAVIRHVPVESFVSEVDSAPPAWRGSLKKAGSTTPSGAYKAVQFNPNQPAGMHPIKVNQPQAAVNEGPQVVHLQYNSPLGLYNKQSADEALRGQTAGKPGQGTLIITGGDGKQEIDWNKSHVYQMIHGQKEQGPQAARYTDHGEDYEGHYEGYQDHSRQSKSFKMLAQQVDGDEGLGSSDF